MVNVKTQGVKGDVKTATAKSINTKTKELKLTPTTGDFSSLVLSGDPVWMGIEYGKDRLPFKTTIKEVKDKEVCVLDKPPPFDFDAAVSKPPAAPLNVMWGTDDSSKIRECIAKAIPGEIIEFPTGIYCAHDILLKSDVLLQSATDENATLTQLIGDNSTYFFRDSDENGPLNNVTFSRLILDGNNNDSRNYKTCMPLAIESVDNHSNIRFLECQIKNFKYGMRIKNKIGHRFFEISRCKFSNIGGYAVGFNNSNTTGIIISECEFVDFVKGIEIFPAPATLSDLWNTCDRVLIERCRFSGDMKTYPIHFGGGPSKKGDFRLAATNVDVKNCIILGPNKWYLHNSGGSADQIALYGVKHFSVTGNVSINGGDGGIVIQDSNTGQYHETNVKEILVLE